MGKQQARELGHLAGHAGTTFPTQRAKARNFQAEKRGEPDRSNVQYTRSSICVRRSSETKGCGRSPRPPNRRTRPRCTQEPPTPLTHARAHAHMSLLRGFVTAVVAAPCILGTLALVASDGDVETLGGWVHGLTDTASQAKKRRRSKKKKRRKKRKTKTQDTDEDDDGGEQQPQSTSARRWSDTGDGSSEPRFRAAAAAATPHGQCVPRAQHHLEVPQQRQQPGCLQWMTSQRKQV